MYYSTFTFVYLQIIFEGVVLVAFLFSVNCQIKLTLTLYVRLKRNKAAVQACNTKYLQRAGIYCDVRMNVVILQVPRVKLLSAAYLRWLRLNPPEFRPIQNLERK